MALGFRLNNKPMKLKAYAAKLAKLAEKYPDANVVHSKDDEGNGFGEVIYDPTAGTFAEGEFSKSENVNAVCVN